MIVRRLFALAGALAAGLGVPALAAAPHPREVPAAAAVESLAALPLAPPARVFARADGAAEAGPPLAARAQAAFDAHRSAGGDRRPVTRFTQVRTLARAGLAVYVFRIEFAAPPTIEESIAWDAAGNVAYLAFGPAR